MADNAVTNVHLEMKPSIPLSGIWSNNRCRTWRSQINGLAEPTDSDDAATKIM
jgi:hypothetical protein